MFSSGTAIYAFFITANQAKGATTFTNLSFTLDGNHESPFEHYPSPTTAYEFNVTGFAKTGLENGNHVFIILNEIGSDSSLALFDFLVYTSVHDFL